MNPYFFWILIICVLGAFSIPFIVLLIIGFRKRSRLLKWIGGVPVAGLFALIVLVLYFVVTAIVRPYADTTSGTIIRSSIVNTFGFQPGSDFVPLNQRIFTVADTGGMYLQFKADSSTFEKIHEMNFQPIDGLKFFENTAGPNSPSWWIRTNQIPGIFYSNSKWKGPYSGNRAYLCYESNSGVIYFLTAGSD